ncbi:MAG: UDP-N-acetylmuramoyl-tripeptide--D-alanyl-D-alanine ligase [Chitinophagaceae bacterium]
MNIESIYKLYIQNPSVQTDTRKLKKGDLYFALKGDRFDGNQYASQAIELGASYAIIDNEDLAENENMILVKDVLTCLQELALYHRKQFKIPFIAITGSNGKTTTKELCHAVLSSTYKTIATKGNLNNHIGIPLTILSIPLDTEIAIIEMGANHLHEIEQYCKYTLPTHGLINNCGKAHIEGFGSEEGVRQAKGELYAYIKQHQGELFINSDLVYLQQMAQGINRQFKYGSHTGDVIGKPIMTNDLLQVAILTHGQETLIQTQLVGQYNFPNVMAAISMGVYFQININIIQKAIEQYSPDNSRSQKIIQGSNTIILDAYNANPSSMEEAIKNFQQTRFENKIVMLGGMKELGKNSVFEHQHIVDLLLKTNWNHVVLVGGDFEFTTHPFIFFKEIEDAKKWYQQQRFEHTAILIKGSRAIGMEKILMNEKA